MCLYNTNAVTLNILLSNRPNSEKKKYYGFHNNIKHNYYIFIEHQIRILECQKYYGLQMLVWYIFMWHVPLKFYKDEVSFWPDPLENSWNPIWKHFSFNLAKKSEFQLIFGSRLWSSLVFPVQIQPIKVVLPQKFYRRLDECLTVCPVGQHNGESGVNKKMYGCLFHW